MAEEDLDVGGVGGAKPPRPDTPWSTTEGLTLAQQIRQKRRARNRKYRYVVAALGAVLFVGGTVALGSRVFDRPRVIVEVQKILDVAGVDAKPQVQTSLYRQRVDTDRPACAGVGGDAFIQAKAVNIRDAEVPPEEMANRLIAHYRETGGIIQRWEPTVPTDTAYLITVLDLDRHMKVEFEAYTNGMLRVRAVSNDCKMDRYLHPPAGSWREVLRYP